MLQKTLTGIIVILFFSLGWLSSSLATQINSTTISAPVIAPPVFPTANAVKEVDVRNEVPEEKKIFLGFEVAPERTSPQDWVSEDRIKVWSNKVEIDTRGMPGVGWAKFTDTNSMDPLLDSESNAIEIEPTSPDQLKVGDIISYDSPYGSIIHRIKAIGNDKKGWYAITQGDNITQPDPDKVRWEQVRRVVVAIIY